MIRGVLVASMLVVAGVAHADAPKRYEGPLVHFSYAANATAAPGADPSADVAVTVTYPNGIVATVLGSEKKVADGELEGLATTWHAARIKNRAAWGMKAGGGPPRDSVRVGDKRWLRWRDRIGSVLGAQEQTMTCGAVSGRLGCVVVSAPQKERERGDAIAAAILGSLSIKKK